MQRSTVGGIALRFETAGQVFQVSGANAYATRWMADELQFHRSDASSNPAVTVEFPVHRSGAGWQRHSRRLVARWHYRLEIREGSVTIEAIGNRLSVPLVFHMLVSPSLRLMAARRGILMLHSGTVSERGRSIVFAGSGGAGKTTTTSLLMAAGGYNRGLQADDYTFFDGRISKPFVTRSHLYGDILRWVPEIGARLTFMERHRAVALQAARRWSRGALRWPVRLHQERLWGAREVDAEAHPAAIVIIGRGGVTKPELTEVEGSTVVSQLLGMNFSEAGRFIELLRKAHGQERTVELIGEWQTLERELLEDLVNHVPVWRMTLPKIPPRDNAKLVGRLEEIFSR